MTSVPAVTDAELAILEQLWKTAPQTTRALVEAIYPSRTPSDIATVQKLIQRLEAKGLVARDRGARIHQFSPTVSCEAYGGDRLAELADRLTEGSVAPLLLHLVNSQALTAGELAELREVLNTTASNRKGQS